MLLPESLLLRSFSILIPRLHALILSVASCDICCAACARWPLAYSLLLAPLALFGPLALVSSSLLLLLLSGRLPSGCRSYYMDLLLRMPILETQYRSTLGLLRIPLSSARRTISKLLSKLLFEHHMARSNSNSNASEIRVANVPSPWWNCLTLPSAQGRLSTVELIQPDNLL